DAAGFRGPVGNFGESLVVGELEVARVAGRAPEGHHDSVRGRSDRRVHVDPRRRRLVDEPAPARVSDAVYRIEYRRVVNGVESGGQGRRIAREARGIERLSIPVENGILGQ